MAENQKVSQAVNADEVHLPTVSLEEIQRSPRATSKSVRIDNDVPENNKISEYVQMALDGKDLSKCSIRTLQLVVDELKAKRDNQSAVGLFDESETSNITMHQVRDILASKLKDQAQRSRQNEFKKRLRVAHDEYAQIQEQAKQQERNMYAQLDAEKQHVCERHTREINELTREWESPEKARRYNRTSGHLRQLRSQAVKLLNAHRYDEAKIVEKRANELEMKESMEMQRKMEVDFSNALMALQQKHQLEIEVIDRAQAIKLKEHAAAKDFDLGIAANKIAKLEHEVEGSADGERVWNLYHRNDHRAKGSVTKGCKMSAAAKKRFASPQDQKKVKSLPPLKEPRSARRRKDMLATLRQSQNVYPRPYLLEM